MSLPIAALYAMTESFESSWVDGYTHDDGRQYVNDHYKRKAKRKKTKAQKLARRKNRKTK